MARLERVRLLPARELDVSLAALRRAREAVSRLDLGACRPEVREQWEADLAQLELGVYDEGVDLFAPYLNGTASLFDHLGEGALVLAAGGVEGVRRAALRHLEESEGLRDQEEARAGSCPPALAAGCSARRLLEPHLGRAVELMPGEVGGPGTADLGWRGAEPYAGRWDAFAAELGAELARGGCCLVVSRQEGRVEELAGEAGLTPSLVDDPDAESLPAAAGTLLVVGGEVSAGFRAPQLELAVFSDHELFGVVKRRGSPLARGARRAESTSARGARRAAAGRATAPGFVLEFAPGDLVVHRDHGVGRFVEMRRVAAGEAPAGVAGEEGVAPGGVGAPRAGVHAPGVRGRRPALRPGPAPGPHRPLCRRLQLPHPALSRLGTGEWERTKRRVRERTEAVARELLALYSRREAAPGHAFSVDGDWQRELEGSFPFEETPDQVLLEVYPANQPSCELPVLPAAGRVKPRRRTAV